MMLQSLLGRTGSQRLLRLAFRLAPQREFLIAGQQRLTRGQVAATLQALAGGLQALGVQPAERIVTLLPACPEAVYAMFLPQTIGTVNVPLNPLLGERELRHILQDCRPSVIITSADWYGRTFPDLIADLLPALPGLRAVLVRGLSENQEPAPGSRFQSLAALLAQNHPVRPVPMRGDELTQLTYTSGTTGLPKGVMHSPRQNFSLLSAGAWQRLRRGRMRCLLLPFPPYQYAGMLGITATLLSGGKVILAERFNPGELLAAIEREGVSQMIASPTMYRLMLRWPGQENYDLTSLRRISTSTEPCPPDLARALAERLGCPVENAYGTSESRLIAWTGIQDAWLRSAETVGRPLPGVQVRIVDAGRRPLPPGQRGEIAVRSPQMMSGYYNDPELTATVLDPQGWFYTGDIGWLGPDGYLRLVDRQKDLIIRGGQNIYPAEVEAHLLTHPAIRQAAVVGVPDALAGERVWAFIEPQPGAVLDAAGVLAHCRGQLAPYKLPEAVRFLERLPRSAAGKIQKYHLRQLAAAEMRAHATHP